MKIFQLSSGIKFAFKKSSTPVAYCALSIKSGTRDEPSQYGGLAHLTEHMLFKGTSKKSAGVINSYLEKLGGELNAYTSKEELVLHATLLKGDLPKAVGLLCEIVFDSVFPKKELEKEKDVVLDEINSYKDSPSDLIFDEFEELLFEGESLSRPVLGNPKSVKSITDKAMIEYVKDNFIPSNMNITIVADVDHKKILSLVQKVVSKYTGYENSVVEIDTSFTERINHHDSLSIGRQFNVHRNRKNHQAHCIIGTSSYSLYDEEKRYSMILLTNILGGAAANSRLNVSLREKRGLVYNVEASFVQYADTGVSTIYFGCDKSNLDKCIQLIYKELEEIKSLPFSERYLIAAKRQLLGQLAISSDNGEAQVLSMGKSLMTYGNILDTEKIKEKILSISTQMIQQVANEVFADKRLSVLIYK